MSGLTEVQFFTALTRAGFEVRHLLKLETMAWAHGAAVVFNGGAGKVLFTAGSEGSWAASMDDLDVEVEEQPTARALAAALATAISTARGQGGQNMGTFDDFDDDDDADGTTPPSRTREPKSYPVTFATTITVFVDAFDADDALATAGCYKAQLQEEIEAVVVGIAERSGYLNNVAVDMDDPTVAPSDDDDEHGIDEFDSDDAVDGLGEE